ncbi:MAG: hypothetical protein HZC36_06270 [Armatimonadetes bacterium]|nr:hypothetical protein [Armatimonadota bacterium]
MLIVNLMASAWLIGPISVEEVAIPVTKVASTYLLSRMSRPEGPPVLPNETVKCGLVPDFELRADARRNEVVAKGPKEKVDELQRVIALFDEDPMRIKLRVMYDIPLFGVKADSTLTLTNNAETKFSEPSADFEAKIRMRINHDGTITAFFEFRRAGQMKAVVSRFRAGESMAGDSDTWANFEFSHEPSSAELQKRGIGNFDRSILSENMTPTGFWFWCTADVIPRKQSIKQLQH